MIGLILGTSGMLGRELARAAPTYLDEVRTIPGRPEIDVTDAASVRALRLDDIDVAVNATGYTDVDGAESDPETAERVNAEGVGLLADTCAQAGVLLVHYSTDYVFDGADRAPLTTSHEPSPLNVYGRTKLRGEQLIRHGGGEHLVLRTSWLFATHGRNFFLTILRLGAERSNMAVVDDQVGRPTSCRDLAHMTFQLVEQGARGTLHVANAGACSWYDFARCIVEGAGLDCTVTPCATAEMPRPAIRPQYSVLDISKTGTLIGPPHHWQSALDECLGEMNINSTARDAR